MKPTIIAIVGASGSGKTYLSKLLQNELNVFLLVSYTTRPPREGEIEGLDHYYIENTYRFSHSQMLSYTRFAEHEYFALEEQVPPQKHCAYVVDERGLKYLKDTKSHKFNIMSIRVESTYDTLIKRGIASERIKRDENRVLLPLDYYDFVIENNGTLEEFEDKIRETYKKIQQWQHQK
jgi:guanylate kinase